MKKTRTSSYLMMIGAMLIYGTIGIFRRYIPFSSGMLAFVRGILGSVCLLLFTRLKKHRFARGVPRRTIALLVLAGGLMGFNWIVLFEAYEYTSVATATLCYYMEPTILILLSPLLFREKLTARKLVCVLLSLGGMVLVSGVTEGGIGRGDLRGVALGLLAAVLYAAVVILNKLLPLDDAYEKTIVQLSSAAVVLIPYLLLTEQPMTEPVTGAAVGMLVIVGVVHTGLAYALYFTGMAGLEAQSIAVLSYIDPVSALILSALILGEGLTPAGLVGAVLIIGASLLCELRPRKKAS